MVIRSLARLARLSLALWVVLALSAPALVHPCAAHDPARATSGESGTHGHHGQHAAPTQDHESAPCTCPGDCSLSQAVALGAAAPHLVAATLPIARTHLLPPALVASRQAAPYAIPWAQAPPVGFRSV